MLLYSILENNFRYLIRIKSAALDEIPDRTGNRFRGGYNVNGDQLT